VVPGLSNRAEKLRRQVIMMKDSATVLLCHDMTLRRKTDGFEIIITKTRGALLKGY
jgi:hypothetical protein